MEVNNGASAPHHDLDYLASILKDSFEEIAQVVPHKLQFLASGDNTLLIPRGTHLASLSTTDTSPLIVCYPLSDSIGN